MTINELMQALAEISGFLFVITSMLAMGLSLTNAQIIEPLKNGSLVILALLANFVLTPLLAYALATIIPLEQDVKVGLIVLATSAGVPFLPKLVQGAKENIAFGVGLMVLHRVMCRRQLW